MEYFNYIEHYFDMASAVPFFLVSLAGLIFVMGVILALARIRQELDRHGASSVATADEANAADLDVQTRPQSRARYQYADRIDDRLSGREHWPDTDPATEARPHSRARRPLLDPVDTRPYEFIESFYEMARMRFCSMYGIRTFSVHITTRTSCAPSPSPWRWACRCRRSSRP